MVDENVLKAAEKLARRISQTPAITEADIIEQAASQVEGGDKPEEAELIAQLAKWAAPFFGEGARETVEQHGGLIAMLHEQKGAHKNDTEH